MDLDSDAPSHLHSTWQPMDRHPSWDASGFVCGVRDHHFQDCWQGGSDLWISHYWSFLCSSEFPYDQDKPEVLPHTRNPRRRYSSRGQLGIALCWPVSDFPQWVNHEASGGRWRKGRPGVMCVFLPLGQAIWTPCFCDCLFATRKLFEPFLQRNYLVIFQRWIIVLCIASYNSFPSLK